MVVYISLRFLGKRRVLILLLRVHRPHPGVHAPGRKPSDYRGATIGIQLMRYWLILNFVPISGAKGLTRTVYRWAELQTELESATS